MSWKNIGGFGRIWMRSHECGHARVDLVYGSHYQVTVVKEGFRARVPDVLPTEFFKLESATSAAEAYVKSKGWKWRDGS